MTAALSYVMDSPALSNQRGINFGRVYKQVMHCAAVVYYVIVPLLLLCKARGNSISNALKYGLQDGTLAVSVAQEALIRLND